MSESTVYGEQDVRGRRLISRRGRLGIRSLDAIVLLETGGVEVESVIVSA